MKIVRYFNGSPYSAILRGFVIFLLCAVSVWAVINAAARIKSESKNNAVEICLDWNEVCSLCALNNYPLGDFLERARAIGVTSVALPEESLLSLSESGKIIYFSSREYSKARLLDVIAQGGMVAPNLIASTDQNTVKDISSMLKTRYNIAVKNQKAGKYFLAYPALDPAFIPEYWSEAVTVGFSSDKRKLLSSKDLKTVYKIQNSGDPAWLGLISTENVSGLVWEGAEAPGYQGREQELSATLSGLDLKFVSTEFSSVAGEDYIEKALPALVVRGHVITPAELGRNRNPGFWLSRWIRAVKERNIRFLYFHFWKNRSIEDNTAYLRLTAKNIKDAGFQLAIAVPPAYPLRGRTRFWEYFALLVSVIMPLAGLRLALKRTNYLSSFLVTNLASILGGLMVSSILYDTFFMQKIVDVPMVTTVFFLPVLLSVFILFKRDEMIRIWNKGLEIKHLLIGFAVVAAGVILFLRSGNAAADWLVPDQGFRQMLENVFWARPRTKEFIIGQPLLLLGFYLKNPWIILAGMIGQVSILNTFMHAHTPLAVSLLRTLNSLLLGFVIGIALKEIYKLIKAVRKT